MVRKGQLIALIAISMTALVAADGHKARQFDINLDTDPLHRWDEAVTKIYSSDVETFVSGLVDKFLPSYLRGPIEYIAPIFLKFRGDYGQEIVGISQKIKETNPDSIFTVGVAWILNEIYVLNMGCTSIVTEHPDEHIIQGRNLDYNWPEGLANITFQANFQKGGQTLYHGTMFMGFVGVPTGMRPGAFSVSYDERDQNDSLIGNLFSIFMGRTLPSWAIRNSLEEQKDFQSAIDYLSTAHLVAPAYLIVAGLEDGEGAVLTRKRTDLVDKWSIDTSANRWFLLETNYDHWTPAPKGDDRRDPGNSHMNDMGRDAVSVDNIFNDVMVKSPTKNDTTVYTTVMDPKNGDYDVTIWF